MDEHLLLLEKFNFKKQLKNISKKLKNKKILIYGSGIFFKKIQANYDLSDLNIIGISDSKYKNEQFKQNDLGYSIVPIEKILEIAPDYVLVATLRPFEIIFDLKEKYFKKTKIKVLPLLDKPFWILLGENLWI